MTATERLLGADSRWTAFGSFRPEAEADGLSGALPQVAAVAMLRSMTDPSPSPIDSQVRNALDALYREFAARAPSRIEGCPCCISTRGVDVLLTTPLRQLSGQQLSRYVSGAFLTIGDERDFRYLLPRILDVAANEPANFIDPEIVLGKLQLTNWTAWSVSERRAVEEFVNSWFERALSRDLTVADEFGVSSEAESVLCGAARAGLPLGRWLDRLRERDAAPVLADLKERFPRKLSAFWEDAPAGFDELSAILAPA